MFKKKYFLLLMLLLCTLKNYATVGCSHKINLNEYCSIELAFYDYHRSNITKDVYWDLFIWAKNSQNVLKNVSGDILIDFNIDGNATVYSSLTKNGVIGHG